MLVKDLFFKLLHILEKGEVASGMALETLSSLQREVLEQVEKEIPPKEARMLLEGMPTGYLLSLPAASIARHLRLLRQLDGKPFLCAVEKKEEIYAVYRCKSSGVFQAHGV
jgi:[protein-PII] uridylyltransferase